MLRSSLLRLVTIPAFLQRRAHDRHFRHARSMMLALLESRGGEWVARTRQRVNFAQDLEALWYLRQDIVLVLTEFEGDETARTLTMKVDRFFKGCLPVAMTPRLHRRPA